MRSGWCSAVDLTGVTLKRATVGMGDTLPTRSDGRANGSVGPDGGPATERRGLGTLADGDAVPTPRRPGRAGVPARRLERHRGGDLAARRAVRLRRGRDVRVRRRSVPVVCAAFLVARRRLSDPFRTRFPSARGPGIVELLLAHPIGIT